MRPTIVVPECHLGGTPREHLLEAVKDARNRLLDAQEAMKRMHPNARDYVGPGSSVFLRRALEEHARRLEALAKLDHEMLVLATALIDGRSGEVILDP